MTALDLARFHDLMLLTDGSPDIAIGLIDGPVRLTHPDLDATQVRLLSDSAACQSSSSAACIHGTFVAGILHARRGSAAPALCPACRLLVRPVFAEGQGAGLPSCEPEDLASAIADCLRAGARLLNLSVGLMHASPRAVTILEQALDLAARQGALVVVASGNQGSVGASALVRHPAVLPVAAANADGTIANLSNLGHALGRRGLAAPGDNIESLAPVGATRSFGGTSAAAPFVTGAAALLWSLYTKAPVERIRNALLHPTRAARSSIVPPLLDARAALHAMRAH